MSEDGSKIAPQSHRRSQGAPWARVYSREVWRNLEFPEGFWFEDTVQAYCINSRFRERYIDQALYRYRSNGEGISAKCTNFKKGLDTFWIVDEMLKWCRDLGVAFDQRLFDQTVRQFGPLVDLRTAALNKCEKKSAVLSMLRTPIISPRVCRYPEHVDGRQMGWPALFSAYEKLWVVEACGSGPVVSRGCF